MHIHTETENYIFQKDDENHDRYTCFVFQKFSPGWSKRGSTHNPQG